MNPPEFPIETDFEVRLIYKVFSKSAAGINPCWKNFPHTPDGKKEAEKEAQRLKTQNQKDRKNKK